MTALADLASPQATAAQPDGFEQALNDAYAEGRKDEREAQEDALLDSAQSKLRAREPLTKEEANAHFAAGLFNPTNQVYFRAGLIACREYMARFVEAQSPEIAASIRANWWPQLGPDLGAPRRMAWSELVASGDEEPPIVMRDDISPTLEALPIALGFFPPEVQNELEARAANAQQEKRDV